MGSIDDELSLERPAALKDKTVQMLAVEDEGPSPFTITIARNIIADNETLDSIAPMLAQHLEQFMQTPTLTLPDGTKITLRNFSSSQKETEAIWTIDIKKQESIQIKYI